MIIVLFLASIHASISNLYEYFSSCEHPRIRIRNRRYSHVCNLCVTGALLYCYPVYMIDLVLGNDLNVSMRQNEMPYDFFSVSLTCTHVLHFRFTCAECRIFLCCSILPYFIQIQCIYLSLQNYAVHAHQNKAVEILFTMKSRRSKTAGNKPFKCPYPGCRSSFYEKYNLTAHKKVKHGDFGTGTTGDT